MSEFRGAASATLDTIIAKAIRRYVLTSHDAEDAAMAVTDALLAKGDTYWRAEQHGIRSLDLKQFKKYAYDKPCLVIPLEAS